MRKSAADTLLQGLKTKCVDLATGRIGWKKAKDTVEIDETKKAGLIKRFKKGKLTRFLRFSEPTIDKQALLKDRKAASRYDGITIKPGEDVFYVEPDQLALANNEAKAA